MINIGFNSRLLFNIAEEDKSFIKNTFNFTSQYDNCKLFVLVTDKDKSIKEVKQAIRDLGINTDSYKLVDTDNIKEAIKHYNIVQYVDTRINEGVKDIDSLNKIVLSKLLESNTEITVLKNWMQIFTLLNIIVVTDAYPNREGVKDDKNMESPKI